jgi:hypothetical protein
MGVGKTSAGARGRSRGSVEIQIVCDPHGSTTRTGSSVV